MEAFVNNPRRCAPLRRLQPWTLECMLFHFVPGTMRSRFEGNIHTRQQYEHVLSPTELQPPAIHVSYCEFRRSSISSAVVVLLAPCSIAGTSCTAEWAACRLPPYSAPERRSEPFWPPEDFVNESLVDKSLLLGRVDPRDLGARSEPLLLGLLSALSYRSRESLCLAGWSALWLLVFLGDDSLIAWTFSGVGSSSSESEELLSGIELLCSE
jgi:hypothetical protein